jgi:site-specific DNA-methyltransferase (adenine-specific)
VIATGDGWTLHRGDCIEGMRALADDSVDHVITDPPYSEHTHKRTWTAKTIGRPTVYEGIDFAHLSPDQAYEVAGIARRVCRRWFVAFTDIEGIALWRDAVLNAGLDYVRACFWIKPDATPQFTGDRPASGVEAFVLAHRPGKKRWNAGGKRNVYTHTRTPGGAAHPTTKPLSLMSELLEDFTDPGELILDPFAGSGSTGVACRQIGRRFLGWELSPEYYEIACRRMRGDEAKPNPAQPSLFGGAA